MSKNETASERHEIIEESDETEKSGENRIAAKQFVKMTQQPIGSLLLGLSIPTIISMMVTNIYNIVDTAFIGKLGTSASAATGIVFGYMAILQAVAFMCGQGAGSIMSRRLGAKDIKEATKYTSTGFFMSFGIGLIIAVFTYIFMDPLLVLMGSTATIAPYAKTYIFYILLSAPFFTSSFTMNNLLRYEGKARLGTVGMMTGAVLNICGDMFFIFVLKLGIAGAGISTALSQFISFSILISMYLSGRTQTKISLKYLPRDMAAYLDVATTGFPSLMRQGLNSVATMILNQSAAVYGDAAVSAMSIVSRISFFPMALAIGIGQGFQPISSFNYGAGLKPRVIKAFWTALIAQEIAMFVVSLPIFIFPQYPISWLRNDPEVIEIAVRALRLMCVAQLFMPSTLMVEMGFQSTGAKLMATVSSSLRSGVLFIPVLLIITRLRGLSGVQEAQPVSFIIAFVMSIAFCRIYMKRLRK